MRRILRACFAMSMLASVFAVRRWQSAVPMSRPAVYDVPRLNAPVSLDVDAAATESTIVATDMFRFSFEPAASLAGGDPRGTGALPARIPPTLQVKGIVGGPPWEAIVDGIPGRPAGQVVQSGATYDGLFIVSVGRDSVRVRVADTAFTLFLRKSP